MADPNVIEIKELRKKRFFLELIKNTSACCLNWVRLSVNRNQFKASKDNFEFILSAIGTGINLDVLKDSKLVSSYKSSENEEIKNLYDTVVLIQDKQFFIVADEEKILIETLQWCRCTNGWDEYPQGGVVVGGSAIVYQPQRIFETMMGGVVVGGNADWRQNERFFEIMDGGVVVGGNGSALVIGPDTYIYIWFDSSGSMNTTEEPLNIMKNTLLKNALLPFYNNDSTAYDDHVFVQNYGFERTMDVMMRSAISIPPNTYDPSNYIIPAYTFPEDASNVVVMWFQDESSPYTDFTLGGRTNFYEVDIVALRTKIATFPANFYRGVFFAVDGFPSFQSGLQRPQNNIAPYNVDGFINYGLADRDEFVYKYGITDGGTPAYYLEEVLSALEELGFEVR